MRVHIAFTLPGDIPIYSSALLLGTGATLGLIRAARAAPYEQQATLAGAGLWALFGALAGGRLGYAVFQWPYFQTQPGQIAAVSEGGLSWAGAIAGGALALWLAAGRRGVLFAILGDTLMPVVVGVTAAGWLGCWLDGCAYGATTEGWWGVAAVDEWGILARRWPVQVAGALLAILMLWLLEANKTRMRYPGQAATLGMATLGIQFFSLTYLRADPMPVRYGLRVDAWAALALVWLGLLGLSYINRVRML